MTLIKYFFIIQALLFGLLVRAQSYPFDLPNDIKATININTNEQELFNNLLLGTNIHDLAKSEGQELVRDFNPITIRFPHGLFSNWYDWEQDKARVFGTETFQYDRNGTIRTQEIDYLSSIKIMDANNLRVGINELTALNNDKKSKTTEGYDMIWTFNMSADGPDFNNGSPVSVARYHDLIKRGLQVKAIEMGNECFYPGQRSSIIPNTEDYLARAKSMSKALKALDPNLKLSIPLLRRENSANPNWNKDLTKDTSYFDAITVHTYIGSDPDDASNSDEAYSTALTAREFLRKSVDDYAKKVAPNKPIWLTEWGVKSGGPNAVSALGMADCYMFMSENQDTYERANWFSVNGKLNSFLVWHTVNGKQVIKQPLEKTSYGSTFEILRSVYENSTLLGSHMEVPTLDGVVNAVNARAVKKDGQTIVFVVNLTDREVPFSINIDGDRYYGEFEHKAFAFSSMTDEITLPYHNSPLELIKQGKGNISLPKFSINAITIQENIALPLDFFNLKNNDEIDKGTNLNIKATINTEFKQITLYVNNIALSTKTTAPYEWTGFQQLSNMLDATYQLKLVGITVNNEVIERTITINTPEQWAFTNDFTPHTIPGKIEVENYDEGGENISWYDKSAQSSTYGYRGNDKIDLSTDGKWLKYIQGGEWLEYTVNVERTGSYKLAVKHETRRSPEFEAIKFSFQENGETIFGPLVCTNTGSGVSTIDTFNTALLTKGRHILRLDFIGYGWDMDFFEFILTSNPINYFNVGTVNHPNNPDSYDSGITIQNLLTPTDSLGFSFAGWFSNSECTDSISIPVVASSNSGPKIFYAKWEPMELSGSAFIYGDIVEGNQLFVDTTNIENNSGLLRYQWQRNNKGEFINIEGATSNSYTLSNGDVNNTVRVQIFNNIQLGSIFSVETNKILSKNDTAFTITYDANGGIFSLPNYEIVGMNGHPTFFALPYKEGYQLHAWTNINGETVNEQTNIFSDTTFYAQWDVNVRYTVYFNINNNRTPILTDGYPAFIPELPIEPSQPDSIFINWITSSGECFDSHYLIYEDMEVFPVWQIKQYKLNVVSLHGTILYEPEEANYNIHSTVKLTARPSSKYEFTGWTGDIVSADTTITVVVDSNINLTANYKNLPYYALEVFATNGEVTKYPNSSRYISGSMVTLTATPQKGYEFESWSGDYEGTENPLNIEIIKDMEIFANFINPADTNTYSTSFENSLYKVYPNPNNGIFTVSTNQPNTIEYVLYNILGTEVHRGKINNKETVSIRNKIPGVYILKIGNNDLFQAHRIIVQ